MKYLLSVLFLICPFFAFSQTSLFDFVYESTVDMEKFVLYFGKFKKSTEVFVAHPDKGYYSRRRVSETILIRKPNYELFTKSSHYTNSTVVLHVKQLWSHYQKAYQLDTAMYHYNERKTALKDQGKYGNKLLEESDEIVRKIRVERDWFQKNVFSKEVKYSSGKQKEYARLYHLITLHEKILIDLENNLDKTVPNEINMELYYHLANENLEEIGKINKALFTNDYTFHNIKHQFEHWSRIISEAGNKNNNMSYRNINSLKQRNYYNRWITYHNNKIDIYNVFASKKGFKKYLPFVPCYFSEVKKIHVNREITPEYVLPALSTLQAKSSVSSLKENQIDFLNQQIDAINQNTIQLNKSSNQMYLANKKINAYKQGKWWDNTRYNYLSIDVIDSLTFHNFVRFEKNIDVYFPEYAASLKKINREYLLCAKTIHGYRKEIEGYAINQDHYKGDFERMDEIFSSFPLLIKNYEKLSTTYYKHLRIIYDMHSTLEANNRWVKSSKDMVLLLYKSREKRLELKEQLRKEVKIAIDFTDLSLQLEKYRANKLSNLEGVYPINSSRRYDPNYLYTESGKQIGFFMNKVNYLSSLSKVVTKDDVCSTFNKAVDNYNALVKQAMIKNNKNLKPSENITAVKLLKSIYDVKYWKMVIVDKKYESKDEYDQPTLVNHHAKATVNESQRKKKSKETKNTHYSDESTNGKTTIINNKTIIHNTTEVIHDTIVINNNKADTVYIHDEKSSLEGYPHNNIVFLLDVSYSMTQEGKLPMLKKAMMYMVEKMRWQDEIGIVTFDGKSHELLSPTSASEKKKIKKTIQKLKPNGKTNLYLGLKSAYQVVDKNYKRKGNNKVILATDGSVKIDGKIVKLIREFTQKDIQLTIVSLGDTNDLIHENLKNLVKQANGNYYHIDEQNVDQRLLNEAKKE